MDLEDEPAEGGFLGADQAFFGLGVTGGGGDAHETIEQFLDAEVVEGRSEKDGGQVALEVGFGVEGVVDAFNQMEVFAQTLGIACADVAFQFGTAHVIEGDRFRDGLFGGRVEVKFLLIEVVDPFETGTLVDGPA